MCVCSLQESASLYMLPIYLAGHHGRSPRSAKVVQLPDQAHEVISVHWGVGLSMVSSRPPPLTEDQMTKNLACQVCYVQVADIAVIPCGHMVMCQWCADVVVPVKHNTFPARPTKCPMCRKGIKQRYKIHTAS